MKQQKMIAEEAALRRRKLSTTSEGLKSTYASYIRRYAAAHAVVTASGASGERERMVRDIEKAVGIAIVPARIMAPAAATSPHGRWPKA